MSSQFPYLKISYRSIGPKSCHFQKASLLAFSGSESNKFLKFFWKSGKTLILGSSFFYSMTFSKDFVASSIDFQTFDSSYSFFFYSSLFAFSENILIFSQNFLSFSAFSSSFLKSLGGESIKGCSDFFICEGHTIPPTDQRCGDDFADAELLF